MDHIYIYITVNIARYTNTIEPLLFNVCESQFKSVIRNVQLAVCSKQSLFVQGEHC
jgi:hypothetical protein